MEMSTVLGTEVEMGTVLGRIGYGDITATTKEERTMAIFVMVVGSAFFAWSTARSRPDARCLFSSFFSSLFFSFSEDLLFSLYCFILLFVFIVLFLVLFVSSVMVVGAPPRAGHAPTHFFFFFARCSVLLCLMSLSPFLAIIVHYL